MKEPGEHRRWDPDTPEDEHPAAAVPVQGRCSGQSRTAGSEAAAGEL